MLFRKLQRTDVWITKQLTLSLGLSGLCQPVYLFVLHSVTQSRDFTLKLMFCLFDKWQAWMLKSCSVISHWEWKCTAYCRQKLYSLITVNLHKLSYHIHTFWSSIFCMFFSCWLQIMQMLNCLLNVMFLPYSSCRLWFLLLYIYLVNSPQWTPNLLLLKLNRANSYLTDMEKMLKISSIMICLWNWSAVM